MLNPDQLRLLEPGPFAAQLASLARDGQPDIVRVFGLRSDDGGKTVRVAMPVAPAERTLQNLRANPQVAVVISHMGTYQSMQLKGMVISVESPDEADRQRGQAAGRAFKQGVRAALESSAVLALKTDPEVVLVIEVEQVFKQTPGPGAGQRWTP